MFVGFGTKPVIGTVMQDPRLTKLETKNKTLALIALLQSQLRDLEAQKEAIRKELAMLQPPVLTKPAVTPLRNLNFWSRMRGSWLRNDDNNG